MAADVDRFGFSRLAVATLPVRLAQPAENAEATLELARAADEDGADLVVFPELGLTGYSNDDLFQQHVLLDAARDAIDVVREGSRRLRTVLVVGAPVVADARLYNTALVIRPVRSAPRVHRRGDTRLAGGVPPTVLPDQPVQAIRHAERTEGRIRRLALAPR